MEDQKPAGATTENQESRIKNQGTDSPSTSSGTIPSGSPSTAAKVGQASSGPSTPSSDGAQQGSGRKKWKTRHTVMLVIVLVVAWVVGVQIMAAERYSAVVNVVEGKDKVGVNPTGEKLDFGDLSRDTGASRFVTLKNNGKMQKRIWVIKSGPISEMMKSDKPGWFTLAPGEEVKVEFNVKVPVSAPFQKFSGTVYIFKWPKLF